MVNFLIIHFNQTLLPCLFSKFNCTFCSLDFVNCVKFHLSLLCFVHHCKYSQSLNLGLLERLKERENVLVAEGYLFEFERRGYLQAGAWTPEVVLERPDLVKEMHREFVHAGSDVVQAFTVGFVCKIGKVKYS